MQDIERIAQIQALAQPGRAGRARVEPEPLRVVLCAERLDRVGGHRGRGRDVGQQPSVGPPELQRAVGLSIDLIAPFVDRTVVPATLCRAPDYAECERGLDGEGDLESA
jgi:hypothetical protein